MNNEVKKWILSQQDKCDKIIAEACRDYWNANKHRKNFHYDLKKCHKESYELSRGGDLCYDRLNTALTYSLWYHPRRINTFLSFFIDKLIELSGKKIELFDLGAGTGAVQWAILLTTYGLKKNGIKPPQIRIINIDTSPFMLHFNRDYLWKHFLNQYPFSNNEVQIEYKVNSWNNEKDLNSSNTFIASSYLFDASDNKKKIKNDFLDIVANYSPSTLLLLTSQNKRHYLNSLIPDFKELGYREEKIVNNKLLFNQPLRHINNLRQELKKVYKDINELNNKTTWQDPSHFGVILSKSQNKVSLSTNNRIIQKIDLFNPPITVRKKVNLNKKQKKAARHSNLPSVIIGPAGCGKSIVISEKVINTIRHHDYDINLKILITTFNKSLIGQLSDWLSETLGNSKLTRKGFDFFFKGSKIANIRLLHFDVLPTRLGRINGNLKFDKFLITIAEEAISIVKKENGITTKKFNKVLNPRYLIEEYRRIIYGKQYVKIKDFLFGERNGRPKLKRDGSQRKILWKGVIKYLELLKTKKIESIYIRRHKFLKSLEKELLSIKFDYIFVDEFQDCTQADFRIFNLLLVNPDNLTIAGDLAQAIHIGKSAKIPRFKNMSDRQFHRLVGSYRLPVRVSEAIKPISEAIKIGFNNEDGVGIITPYKGSPPGSRPIFVYASKLDGLANKILDVFNTYSIYEINQVTILEKDVQLLQKMNQLGIKTETDTILRLKGLEKRCIVWSTRMNIEYEKEVFEFVYTILSRTSSILIIALSDKTLNIFNPVIKKFKIDRLILWDKETEEKFKTFRREIL